MRSKVIVFAAIVLSEALITEITFPPIRGVSKQQPCLSTDVKFAAGDKQRVLLVVAESIPFFSVRFVYSIFANFMH
jgi:hypothetical protein